MTSYLCPPQLFDLTNTLVTSSSLLRRYRSVAGVAQVAAHQYGVWPGDMQLPRFRAAGYFSLAVAVFHPVSAHWNLMLLPSQ